MHCRNEEICLYLYTFIKVCYSKLIRKLTVTSCGLTIDGPTRSLLLATTWAREGIPGLVADQRTALVSMAPHQSPCNAWSPNTSSAFIFNILYSILKSNQHNKSGHNSDIQTGKHWHKNGEQFRILFTRNDMREEVAKKSPSVEIGWLDVSWI